MVTPSAILSVLISLHYTICLSESYYNIIYNVINIYRQTNFVSIFMDELYCRYIFIGNYVGKNLHAILVSQIF